MTEKVEKTEVKNEPTVLPKNSEKEEEEKRILQAINEKSKNNLTLKLRLLALYNYSVIENEQTDRMALDIDLIDLKYKQLAVPLIERTNDIVNGKPLFNLDLFKYERYLTQSEANNKKDLFANESKAITDYWFKAFKNNSTLAKYIKPHDNELLQALRIIEYVPSNNIDKPYDFTLKFQFAPNNHFENVELVQYFDMIDEHEAAKTECTKVLWKPGKDITRMEIKKTQKHKKTGAKRNIQKIVDRNSFFSFFRTINYKEEAEDEYEDEKGEEADNIERHVDIAFAIVEEVLPYSNEYYLGTRRETRSGLLKNLAPIDEDDEEDDIKSKSQKEK